MAVLAIYEHRFDRLEASLIRSLKTAFIGMASALLVRYTAITIIIGGFILSTIVVLLFFAGLPLPYICIDLFAALVLGISGPNVMLMIVAGLYLTGALAHTSLVYVRATNA